MFRARFVSGLVVFFLLTCTGFLQAEAVPRSLSTSRQFIVYGNDARLRGAICDLAEQTKTAALRLLREKDDWKTPILVHAEFPQANLPELPPARLNFGQTGFGLKLQLDLVIAAEASAPAIERALLRAIFLEIIYRENPNVPAGTAFVEPPDWLLDGTLAVPNDQKVAAATECLRSIGATGRVISFAEFLRQRPALLDAASQTIYRAYATALVSLVLQAPAGAKHLARFLAELALAPNDPVADFRAHFPEFAIDGSLERAWNRGIAHWAMNDPFRLLDCAGSERQLAETLHLELKNADEVHANFTLEEFPKFVRRAEAAGALQALNRELLLLSSRAHPLYLPVILEYQKIITRLEHRKTKRIAQRLAEARALREQISRTMQGIDDYLNWFEATQSRTASGAFRDYLKTAELARAPEVRRHDPISVYLDAIESLMPH
ncbi:MAG: hypothetical protein ACR2HH_13525 [Chthoniobacterales bacterium]